MLSAIDADPRRAFRARRAVAGARRRGGALVGRAALHARAAPAARAARARVAGRRGSHSHYGDRAHRVVRERPYELTSVFGVGFPTADTIARAAGVAARRRRRARARRSLHVLAEAERDGSTCLPVGDAARARPASCSAARAPDARAAARDGGRRRPGADEDATTTATRSGPTAPQTAALERELAERVHALLADAPSREAARAGRPAARTSLPDGAELAAEQWAGVQGAFAHRFSIVTGGPGTGKTATIRMICAAAGAADARRCCSSRRPAAPRGGWREATGPGGLDVHSALGWIPGQGPTLDEDDPLRCDLLVVDETSMANLELLVTLLRAVGPGTHVVLVGDADQLAPVGAGKPFAELVASEARAGRRAHAHLPPGGRQHDRAAARTRSAQGGAPSFTPRTGMQRDLFLIERADPVAGAASEIVGARQPSGCPSTTASTR